MNGSSLAVRSRQALIRFWKSWRWYFMFLFGVWIPVRSVVADYNPVPTGSMIPTILEGDVVFVNKLAYSLRLPLTLLRLADWAEPQRGDIVVVFSPRDGTRLVKRVVAVPGDTIAMVDDHVTINGQPLSYDAPRENYRDIVPQALKTRAEFAEEDLTGREHVVMALPRLMGARRTFAPITVPAGKYFLMGDNRDNSFDSRYFGFAERKAIIGKAEGVIVSWDIRDTYLPRFSRFFSALH